MNYYDKANLLPVEVRPKIQEALKEIKGIHGLSSSNSYLVYLFDVFNKNINPTPTDRKCDGCVNTITGFWKEMTELWQKNQ